MRVLVTGATGLLGNTIVRELQNRGITASVVLRNEPAPQIFDGLDVSKVFGSLGEPENAPGEKPAPDWLGEAIRDCDAVVHSAAHIHIGWRHLDHSMAVNRLGTRQIAEACRLHSKRLVHIGTVNTLALGNEDAPADEDTSIDPVNRQVACAYTQSKRASVLEVQRVVARGLMATIIHPGFMLGPWDWKPSSGQMILELARRWAPLAPSGGCSLCDSRDVAAGVVNALEMSVESGRSFIMAGHNLSYRQLWDELTVRLGKKPPVGTAPFWLQKMTGHVGDAATCVSGREATLNGAAVGMSRQFHWYDSTRAQTELGYTIRPASETLDDAVAWVRNHHPTR